MAGDLPLFPHYLPHPLAGIVPRMSDDEFLDLRKSIRSCGLVAGEEIVLFEGQILDGRHRYEACRIEGVAPRFREYTDRDPLGYVQAKLTRRNMDPSRKALLVAGLLIRQAEHGETRWTRAELCQRFGVGRTTVLEASRVLQHAVPRLRRMVENGEVTVRHAERVCRLPAVEQQKVVSVGAYSVKSKGWQLRDGKIRLPVPATPPATEITPEVR